MHQNFIFQADDEAWREWIQHQNGTLRYIEFGNSTLDDLSFIASVSKKNSNLNTFKSKNRKKKAAATEVIISNESKKNSKIKIKRNKKNETKI